MTFSVKYYFSANLADLPESYFSIMQKVTYSIWNLINFL